MIEDEAHGHHHHGTGIRWLDLIIAGSAILVSVVSLVVSVGHGRTMEKLVEANALQVRASTLPILRFGSGNLDVTTGKPAVHLDLSNGGTGPAVIQSFQLFVRGRPVSTVPQLLDACCRTDPSQHLGFNMTNLASGQTLAPGQTTTLLEAREAGGNRALYQRLDEHGRFGPFARACYCSVLDECWITDFRRAQPRSVKVCPPPQPGFW